MGSIFRGRRPKYIIGRGDLFLVREDRNGPTNGASLFQLPSQQHFRVAKLRIDDLVRDDYVSFIRNKLLAESFFLLGDIEKYGTGFIRVRKYLAEYPGLCLEINEIGDYFKVVLIDTDASETEKAGTGQAPDKLSLLAYCRHPRIIREMMDHFNLKHRETFMNNHLRPLIDQGLIRMTIPEKPTSPKQKYLTTKTGAKEILPDETDR